MSNYDKMADEAKALFMRRDQEKMIALWDLEHTDDVIVVPWLNQIRYLQRSTGDIYCGRPDDTATAVWDEKKASYCEYMVIYDLLTYAKERPQAKGSFATVASLGGIIGAGHDVNLKPDAAAQFFSEHLAQLKATCETLGGENVSSSKADECWDFTVFMDFKIRFEFWDKDSLPVIIIFTCLEVCGGFIDSDAEGVLVFKFSVGDSSDKVSPAE